MPQNSHRPWALVLSGGGGRGIAHVGVFKALAELGLAPSLVVGNSMGAIIGSVYAAGKSVREMESFVMEELDVRNLLQRPSFKLPDFALFHYIQAQEAMNALILDMGIDDGKRVLEVLKDLTGNVSFDKLKVPFICNAVDLLEGKEIALRTGNVATAVRASMAFPGVFTPVALNGRLLADGCILNYIPTWIARAEGYKRIVTIDVGPFEEVTPDAVKMGITVFFRAFTIATKDQADSARADSRLFITAFDGSDPFDFTRRQQLIDVGYRAVMARADEIRNIVEHPLARLRRMFGMTT